MLIVRQSATWWRRGAPPCSPASARGRFAWGDSSRGGVGVPGRSPARGTQAWGVGRGAGEW